MAKRSGQPRESHLFYLGTRRPATRADVSEFAEVHHSKTEPKPGTPLPPGVHGEAPGEKTP